MVDGLHGLWHDGVVSRDDDDREVGELGTPGSHGGEGLVSRSVKESDPPAVRELDVVSSDVLGDSSSLSGDHVGFADIVEQGSLTMVDMTHDGDHRGS